MPHGPMEHELAQKAEGPSLVTIMGHLLETVTQLAQLSSMGRILACLSEIHVMRIR